MPQWVRKQPVYAVKLQARHRPSGFNGHFLGHGLTFADYIEQTQAMLTQAHARLATPDLLPMVAGVSPFILHPKQQDGQKHPYRRGVMLTHGLTDSPYFMRSLAEILRQQGFYVQCVLLPGHGTQPGDLLYVTWQAWFETLNYGVAELSKQVDEVYLAGFSAGGLMSMLHSVDNPQIHALILFAPALAINPLAAWADLHKLYSFIYLKGHWLQICPDIGRYKYESTTKNLATQMYRLTQVTKEKLRQKPLELPIFVVASVEDCTTQTSATMDWFCQHQHHQSQMLLFAQYPDSLPKQWQKNNIDVIPSHLPEQNILSSAHTAIMLPPDDPFYGKHGQYINAIHYYPDKMDLYQQCLLQSGKIWQGETTEENLAGHCVQRLMFNPQFELMTQNLQQFLYKIAAN